MLHMPVLLEETVSQLVTEPGGWYVDGTAGAGGHASAILAAAGLDAHLLALDCDGEAFELACAALAPFGDRASVVRANFSELAAVADRMGLSGVRGILLDLGVSSMQLDRPERGFSFMRDSALDMRMDDRQSLTAAGLLRQLSREELAEVLWRYGEEPQSRRIARAVAERLERKEPIETTAELADLVSRVKGGRRGRTHPATQTFQALRIALNRELSALETVLPAAVDLLEPGGRLAVISFHSLEDRMVKQFMVAHEGRMESLAKGGSRWSGRLPRGRRVRRKAIKAGAQEIQENPRARSAKLRVWERMESHG